MTPQIRTALRNALRTGLILFVFSLIGTAMLAFTHDRTEPTIARSQQAEKLALISQVLPAALYDNDLLSSQQSAPPDALLGTRKPSAIWIARRDGAVSGVVLEAVAPDGYSGDIALLVGIDIDGNVTGVRVTAHRETPGLGDYIDRAKGAWIDQFAAKSLTAPSPSTGKWRRTAVSSTPAPAPPSPARVVKAVKSALGLFCAPRAALVAATRAGVQP